MLRKMSNRYSSGPPAERLELCESGRPTARQHRNPRTEMIWFMLNMPLAAAFFAAWVAIPLWMTFKHPGTGPAFSAAPRCPDAEAPLAGDKRPEPALAA